MGSVTRRVLSLAEYSQWVQQTGGMTKAEFVRRVEAFTGRRASSIGASPACIGLKLNGERPYIPEMYYCTSGEFYFYGYADGRRYYYHTNLGEPFLPTEF
jgi:hypothetical protein